LSNAFSKVRVSVEVALWPGLTLLGLDAEAEIEKSVPVFSNTLMEFELASIAIRSGRLVSVHIGQDAHGVCTCRKS
jgi:hypothetical protein